MRILKFLFSSFLIFAVVAIVGFLVGREALLYWGTATVKSSLTELQSISVNSVNYVTTCRQQGAPQDQVAVSGLQLRFINNQEYVLEVICTSLQFDPIVVEDKKLPPLVTKQPGSGGIIWGSDPSSVTLTVLGRSQTVGIQDKQIGLLAGTATGVSPQTTCQGRGYTCCNSDAQFGTGEIQSQVSDCPQSCYATCLPRPIVLSFTSDPIMDQQSRTVSIHANQTVSFAYVVSYNNSTTPTVTLDFGDGQTQTFTSLEAQTSHLYTCNLGTCNYQASLSLQTAEQIPSVDNSLSHITVQVQP